MEAEAQAVMLVDQDFYQNEREIRKYLYLG